MALANVERIFNLNPGAIPVQAGGQRQHQNQFRGIWTAIPIIAGAIAWAVANRSTIINGAKTALNVSECVMNNKLKIERDQCHAGLDFLKHNVRSLHHMDVFNRNTSIPLLRDLVEDIREHELTDQWFTEINQKTRTIWENVHTENRMQLRSRISPLMISYENMPRSVGDLVAWIHETASCNEANALCSSEKENIRKKAESTADKLDGCRLKCAQEMQELIERKGQCKDLEEIKREKTDLMKEKQAFLLMKDKFDDLKIKNAQTEKELADLKQRQADDLAAAIKEGDKFFLRRWTGL